MQDLLDIDLDNAEKIIKKQRDRSSKRDKKGRKYSRSRSRKQSRSRSRRRSNDRKNDRNRGRRDEEKRRDHRPDHQLPDLDAEEAKRIQQQMLEREIEMQKRLLEDSKRDDATVQIMFLHPSADENDIYQYFKNGNCGKISDIRIIKDARSGKSKGIAYVEFYLQDSILKAISMTDGFIKGQQIKICPSQADKNRAALATAKLKQQTQKLFETPKQERPKEQQRIIQIGGLVDELEDFSESNIKDLFQVYGKIEFIDLHKEKTGKNKGFAFIQYASSKDAKIAIDKMNGFKIRKRAIKVQPLAYNMEHLVGKGGSGDDLDDTNMTLHSQASKAVLMQKLLQRDPPKADNNNSIAPIIQNFGQSFDILNSKLPDIQTFCMQTNPLDISNNPLVTQFLSQESSQQQPYQCLVISNMIQPEECDNKFIVESVLNEVKQECSKFGKIQVINCENGGSGKVWVMFTNTDESKKAFDSLNNQYFREKRIYLSYASDRCYQIMFK